MSILVDEAFEVSSLTLGTDDNAIGLYVGGVLPHVAVPDAPLYSVYYRTSGEVYTNDNGGGGLGSLATDWKLSTEATNTSSIPFFNFDTTTDNIALTPGGEVPFFNFDGTLDDIGLTI